MANTSRPSGFSPVRTQMAGSTNGQGNLYYIPSTDTNAYYIGDPVKTSAGADANGVPQVVKAAGTDKVRGVFIGAQAASTTTSFQGVTLTLEQTSIPATKTRDYYIYVEDDPQAWFEVQDDGLTAGNCVAASVGLNSSFTVATPSLATQLSASVLTSSTFASTTTLNVKILGLVQTPDNAFGINAKWLVKFNQHELAGNGN